MKKIRTNTKWEIICRIIVEVGNPYLNTSSSGIRSDDGQYILSYGRTKKIVLRGWALLWRDMMDAGGGLDSRSPPLSSSFSLPLLLEGNLPIHIGISTHARRDILVSEVTGTITSISIKSNILLNGIEEVSPRDRPNTNTIVLCSKQLATSNISKRYHDDHPLQSCKSINLICRRRHQRPRRSCSRSSHSERWWRTMRRRQCHWRRWRQ